MALPLLLGLGGSALAGSLGANALLYGAVGSGLGSLAQGDDFETAVGTGLMSYFGGKALGGMFGGGADKLANVPQQPLVSSQLPMSGSLAQNMISGGSPITAQAAIDAQKAAASAASSGSKFADFFKSPAGATIKGSGLEGIKQAATNPYALGAVGTTGLLESMKPQGVDMPSDDYDIPEAEAAKRKRNPILPGYRPGIDPEMPYFTYAEGGEVQKPNDKEIISNAVDAIKGSHPQPETALAMFVSTYGEEALRDLVGRVRSGEFDDNAQVTEGMVEGVGDGMDDMIPATLEGEQDVVLSDGEFIVPADVVSGLGNGSTDAGAKSLYEMMDRVREMRTGMTEQPDQVPQDMMLPA
jgi:hypothetical protein